MRFTYPELSTVSHNGRYYTYIYRDENDIPIYVGKGTGKRALHHLRPSEKTTFALAIRGTNPSIQIIEAEDQAAAYQLERELVIKFGRLDLGTGTLYNRTNGGGMFKALIRTAEHKRNISEALKGKTLSAERKAKIGQAHRGVPKRFKGMKHTDETRAKMAAAKLGRKRESWSEEYKQKMSEAIKASRARQREIQLS